MYSTFKEWVGDENALTKQYAVKYINDKGYKSVVDMGCGDATMFYGIKNKYPDIEYVGVDSCSFFITMNKRRNIPVIESDIRNVTNLADSSMDICFSRHTFEHQSFFKDILKEMIRIGKKEACHIFFIKPSNEENINYDSKTDLYHNTYSKNDIEEYLLTNPKVASWNWTDLTQSENALHIYLHN